MDDVVWKNAEKAAFLSDVKFCDGTVEFQRLHRTISKDDAVPANIATVVAFRDDVIRG